MSSTADVPAPDESNPTHGSSNPFRNALHKFQKKKKEKASLGGSATSGFFSRGSRGKSSQNQPLPGSVKQVCAGQLPPVWATPPAAPPRKMSSPTVGSVKSPRMKTASLGSDHTEEIVAALEDASISSKPTETTNAETAPTSAPTPSAPPRSSSRNAAGNHRCEQFNQVLRNENVDLDKLRELSWGGIPYDHRPTAWRLLLGYMPSKQDRREAMLQRKRQEYKELLQQYYYIPDTDRGSKEQGTLRQILVDIPRTNADVRLFQDERIHQCMERVLYTWAIRHPASGYVQGINDLLTPFLVVFLTEFMDDPPTGDLSIVSDERLETIEADSYWCLTKLLDGIQDHYTFAQPGLQRMVQRMEELVHRCDVDLFKHIVERENVQFVQFAFRWMNCLLMREVPLTAIIRIWDTYLCEDNGFESFHVYVCAAILMTFGEKLKTLEFQDLVLFLQHLPTKDWSEDEIDPLLSRAFILQTYFADSPSHLVS
ncbi:hypothetical protein Poli38472_004681 [Pythium oligandrum]|uniref:Rab-GAP TBC domain-containing protein n=1 Tax=Pythium oligandrum TaxID=41045 RepID=A0A8K1FHD0_PYTOL|nr:hypothetical protein Poli38472_004681 [Pythium oligandrum]|eukprot:TMW59612.1 hypothetical protein Poli38472_004681 [Pythium oligandrum]